jgi:hypothetical protein
MVDPQEAPRLDEATVQEEELRAQRRFDSIQVMKYGPAMWSVIFLYRIGLTISCFKAVRWAMLTGPCCAGPYFAAWWVMGLFFYLILTFLCRTTWFYSAFLHWRFNPADHLAILYAPSHVHQFNAAVLAVGAVWSVCGIVCAFLMPAEDDSRELFRAILSYGISTFIIYPAELYVLHWVLVPLREDLHDLINPHPRRQFKRGSLNCCAVVVFDEPAFAESGSARECAVCLDEFQHGIRVRRTPCGHFFHEQCIQGWFRQGAFCPLCRVDCSGSRAELEQERA